MHRRGDDLLAGAGLPQDEDRGVGALGHPLDQLHDSLDLVALGHHAGQVLGEAALLQGSDLLAQADALQGVVYGGLQGLHVQGLDHVIVHPLFHGRDHGVYVLKGGDHDEQHLGVQGLDAPQSLNPVHARQADVQKDQVRGLFF